MTSLYLTPDQCLEYDRNKWIMGPMTELRIIQQVWDYYTSLMTSIKYNIESAETEEMIYKMEDLERDVFYDFRLFANAASFNLLPICRPTTYYKCLIYVDIYEIWTLGKRGIHIVWGENMEKDPSAPEREFYRSHTSWIFEDGKLPRPK